MIKKNNQAKSHFAYKHDEIELTEVGQFLRDVFPQLTVKVEWYVVFNKEGKYDHIRQFIPKGWDSYMKYRWPDIIILKDNKLLCCIEIDGVIHKKKLSNTLNRNDQYKNAGIDLIVADKLEIKTSLFDYIYKKIEEKING